MRVIDPRNNNPPINRKKKIPKSSLLFIGLLVLLGVAFMIFRSNSSDLAVDDKPLELNQVQDNTEADDIEPELPNEFSGNEFRLLYDNLLLPNTEKINTPPIISGNDIADARIRQLAETRGYKIRSTPSVPLPSIDGFQLQEAVHQPWKNLQKSASNDGLSITIVSAYRSIESQKNLFVQRLQTEGVSLVDVANGIADDEITKVLTTTSIPGYSKHHSGYTVDFLCAGWIFEDFEKSDCNKWLVANNYENAKEFGFIPSYPVDADLQGPDPEAWEYVYVGTEILNP